MSRFLLFFILSGQVTIHFSAGQSFKAEVIDYKTTCSIENNNLTTTVNYLIQINNKTGDDAAQISIGYKKHNKVLIDHAWIEDTAGNVIRKLKNKDITDVSAFESLTIYQDYYYKNFSLLHNIYPYRINVEYSITVDQFIGICRWNPVFDYEIPTHHAELLVRIPAGYQVRINQQNISPYTLLNNIDTLLTHIENSEYQWSASYEVPLKAENYSPPSADFMPRVAIIPLNFNYGVDGTTKDWTSYGNWVYRLNDGLNTLPLTEQAEIQGIITKCTNSKDKIIGLYHYLEDHTRYINVSIDVGGHQSYPASYVAQNKYGDCKALTNYMKSVLEIAGIKSFYTLIYLDYVPPTMITEFPSPQFNHVMLTVPIEKDTIWLETTSNINPFGYNGTQTQNRKALLVDEENSHLIESPKLLPMEVLNERVIQILIKDNTTIQVKMEYNVRGYNFELLNEVYSKLNHNDQDKFIKKHFSPGNFEILNWEIKKADRDSAYIGLNLSAINQFYLKNYGPYKALPLFEFDIPQLDPVSKRTLPVLFPFPYNLEDSITIELPDKLVPISLPADTVITSGFGEYSRITNKNNSRLIILKHLIIYSGNYQLSNYPDLYNFLESARKEERKMILFK